MQQTDFCVHFYTAHVIGILGNTIVTPQHFCWGLYNSQAKFRAIYLFFPFFFFLVSLAVSPCLPFFFLVYFNLRDSVEKKSGSYANEFCASLLKIQA